MVFPFERSLSMRYMTVLCVLSFLTIPAPALAQHEGHGAAGADTVGSASVSFQTSCAPAVRGDFNRAVALLHSFWFAQAIETFTKVLAADPACAMAHWGVALSEWGNPFAGLRAPQQIERGRAAIQKAQATGSPTPRERGYIEAAAALFTDGAAATQRARTVAYADGMEKVARANPGDTEAQIFYALALNQTALPSDKTYAQQLKAAAILEPLFKQHPSHPGLAHYIIHAYDHPPLAPKALDAARRYASLAPAVPHALHMPSHTFTRVGSWKESIETNRRSAEAARTSSTAGEELHALDYQAYAYLQIAQDQAAKSVVDRAAALTQGADGIAVGAAGAGAFAVAAIPARYALERGAWAEAAALTVRPAKTPYTEAMTHFARALGAARTGQPKAAAPDIERLASLRDTLKSMQDAYWAEQVDIQRRVALAWVTFAEGRKEEGIAQLRAAADAEDATDKSAVSPGPLAPARELLGDMLLEAGQPREALASFEASTKKEPNRFRGLYGAGRAAEAAGDRAKAVGFYKQLLAVAAEADTNRPELQHARTIVGGRRS
jgi:tetratricopeptide (TPR) repeat protein